MKTSKHFKDLPFENIKGKFAVVRESNRKMVFSSIHSDILDAVAEAERLSTEKQARFMVVKSVAIIGY